MRLAASFWKGVVRDDSSRLPALLNTQAIELLQTTIRGALDNHGSVACLFFDLDNFKQVNDRLAMTIGDDVIKQVAGILYSASDPYGIPVHRSGDEFIVVLPHGDHNDAFELGSEIVRQVTGHNFDTGEVKVGISCGIACSAVNTVISHIKISSNWPKRRLKLPDGTKLRGKATLRSAVDEIYISGV